jgi:hypothetical protein
MHETKFSHECINAKAQIMVIYGFNFVHFHSKGSVVNCTLQADNL